MNGCCRHCFLPRLAFIQAHYIITSSFEQCAIATSELLHVDIDPLPFLGLFAMLLQRLWRAAQEVVGIVRAQGQANSSKSNTNSEAELLPIAVAYCCGLLLCPVADVYCCGLQHTC